MRFSVPRSLSPSPVRSHKPRPSPPTTIPGRYGLNSDTESDVESEAGTSTSSSLSISRSESLRHTPSCPRKLTREEQCIIDDTVASIRLRTRQGDPYEDWERQTKRDAFKTARKEHHDVIENLNTFVSQKRLDETARRTALYQKQMTDMRKHLDMLKLNREKEESGIRSDKSSQIAALSQRIEAGISVDEKKVQEQLEAARKVREEVERKQKEEQLQKKLVEEKRIQAEEEKRKLEEEEKRAKEEIKKAEEEKTRQEAEEVRNAQKEAARRAERLQAEGPQREVLGLSAQEDEWKKARSDLLTLKTNFMRPVKAHKEAKSIWGNARRQITPKIGQLTNDVAAINRISQQILDIIKPHPPEIYHALLSSLSKTIILQAETEVTAEKLSSVPLSQVAFNLLGVLDGFADIFFAKLVQRVGGWPIPITAIPFTGAETPEEKLRIRGIRKVESGALESTYDRIIRVSGIMRVYFGILKLQPSNPLGSMFQTPRYWIWFSRILSERGCWGEPMTVELIFTALDVMGQQAKEIYGYQFIKMLELIYQGVTDGYAPGKYLGGDTPEGRAGRTRVELQIETIMKS